MDFVMTDFNDADAYYAGEGAQEWADIEGIIRRLPLCFQGSLQAGIGGSPIFDPKATNAFLTSQALALGWRSIPLPTDLREFGNDWDAGKGATLAEWQFSNYPFLWNDVVRAEAVYKGQIRLENLAPIKALIVVTKSGVFPSSNSSLYFEQAKAQLSGATKFKTFSIPVRLVGLTIPPETESVAITWSEYGGRTSRTVIRQVTKPMAVKWTKRKGKYGSSSARFEEP